MQLLGTKRLKDGRQMLPAGGYSQPTENQGIMDMETGEIIALSKKDQRIADAKKNRKEIMEKLQDKVDKENAFVRTNDSAEADTEIREYKSKPQAFQNTVTLEDANKSRAKQFNQSVDEWKDLQRRRERVASSKRKNKVSEVAKIDKKIKQEERNLSTYGKWFNAPRELSRPSSVGVGDRIVRVLSGGKDGTTVEGKMHIPYGISTKGESGYLSPRISVTGREVKVDFTKEGVGSGGSLYQGTAKQRREIEQYVRDYRKDIESILLKE
jgi:hypothetical protein